MFRYLPEQASEVAADVDWLHNWITDIAVLFTVVIVGAMLYFVLRYHRRGGVDHETPRLEGNSFLEVVWTVVPTLICVWVAYYGITIYSKMVYVPQDALEVNLRAWQWGWEATYNYKDTDEAGSEVYREKKISSLSKKPFVVPVDKTVKFIMTSDDVLHSFFLPSMRVKRDVVPGRYTYVAFKPVKTGTYQAFCTEYCGDNHWDMMAQLKVVSDAEYDRWLHDRSDEFAAAGMNPVELGQKLYVEKGCVACHSLDGTKLVGPSLMNLYGKERSFLEGEPLQADENYIKESILTPDTRVVQGFAKGQMPAFSGQLSDREVESLIAFIKTADESSAVEIQTEPQAEPVDLSQLSPEERGKQLYSSPAYACNACHSIDGSMLVAPSLQGLYGKQGKLNTGEEYTADDAYLKTAILNPGAQVVEGFQPLMPPFEGRLSEDQVDDLIAFIKSLGSE